MLSLKETLSPFDSLLPLWDYRKGRKKPYILVVNYTMNNK